MELMSESNQDHFKTPRDMKNKKAKTKNKFYFLIFDTYFINSINFYYVYSTITQ